jgi:hypothetical protein
MDRIGVVADQRQRTGRERRQRIDRDGGRPRFLRRIFERDVGVERVRLGAVERHRPGREIPGVDRNARWKNLNIAGPTGPAARVGAAMATLNGKIVMFGGNDADGCFDDTWIFDGASWSLLSVTGPSNRTGSAVAVY